MTSAHPTDHPSDLLRRAPPREAIEWAVRAVGAGGRISSVEPLVGGASHANHVLRVDSGDGIVEVVMRRWVRADW